MTATTQKAVQTSQSTKSTKQNIKRLVIYFSKQTVKK